MSAVRTSRMRGIASDLADEGRYSAGHAVGKFVDQYDELVIALRALKRISTASWEAPEFQAAHDLLTRIST